MNQCGMAERVGFEPTVRLPVQRFSSSMILMLACAVQSLSVCSGLAFLRQRCWIVLPDTDVCRVVGLQFGLQTSHRPMSAYLAKADLHKARPYIRL
jgi:hypothetical protein